MFDSHQPLPEKGKGSLLPINVQFNPLHPRSRSRYSPVNVTAFLVAAALIATGLRVYDTATRNYAVTHDAQASVVSPEQLCPQAEVLIPKKNFDVWERVGRELGSGDYKESAIDWLSRAVQIPTETYDGMGPVDEDPRWENRLLFHDFLKETFPSVHAILKVETVNKYGLLLTWEGSDSSLEPALLMAHFDVVPVNLDTVSEWAHPPYSGYFDGEFIWGRGSNDDKSGLIGTIGAIETLIRQGFKPARTFVAAFGFDEEAGGLKGAGELSKTVLDRYGEDSFAFIIDEGGGFSEQYGTVFATPGVAEKGSMNVDIIVASPGGHSSVPPDHTSIGVLSALLVHLENHPFEVHVGRETSTYQLFQCFAEHGADVSPALRDAIKRSVDSDEALRDAEEILFQDRMFKSLVGTTQAADIIHGGVKSNALPENAWATVNFRIATTSSVDEMKKHDTELFLPLAKHFNLTFDAFGELLSTPGASAKGSLNLTSSKLVGLEPAPVTPIKGDASAPYQLLSGTIKATYNAHRNLQGDNIAVGPGMPTGNTDTKYYWALSNHIFRYNHHNGGSSNNPLSGAHTVNESLSAESLLETIRFFTTLILNADESNRI